MTWVGAIILIFGVAFFLKYAVEQGWIGPAARVIMGVMFGLALLGLGDYLIRRDYRWLAQGLMGTGLAALYASLFAAFARYHLISQPVAFGAMILVTSGGMTLAMYRKAYPICLLAGIGGFLTPLLLSTGVINRDGLFTYLMILDAGMLGITMRMRWRGLDWLAFIGTTCYYARLYIDLNHVTDVAPWLLWLGGTYVLFLVLPLVRPLMRREALRADTLLLTLANAGAAFGYSNCVLLDTHRSSITMIALALCAIHAALAVVVRRNTPSERAQVLLFVIVSVVLLVVAPLFRHHDRGTLFAWAMAAPAILAVGYLLNYSPLRVLSLALLILTVIWDFARTWPDHGTTFAFAGNKAFATAMAAPVAAAVCSVVHWMNRKRSAFFDNSMRGMTACFAGAMGLLLFNVELHQWLYFNRPSEYEDACINAALWPCAAIVYVLLGLYLRSGITRAWGAFLLAVSTTLWIVLITEQLPPTPYVPVANLRFGVLFFFIAVLAMLALFWWKAGASQNKGERDVPSLLVWGAALLLLALLSHESCQYCDQLQLRKIQAHRLALMSLSVVWGVYAAALLAIGVAMRNANQRYVALALFGLTIGKLFVIDLWKLTGVYRWGGFLLTGALLIVGSYLYYRLERIINARTAEK